MQKHQQDAINNNSQLEQLQVLKSELAAIEQTIIEKFKREGFESSTTIQKKALPVIARKMNCLLLAPTASGKTEAAVLPVFTLLAQDKKNHINPQSRIRAIYVTPLRALNNDVLRRIVKYAQSESLRVEIRHGDTTARARKNILENPPDILITTPESLEVVLTNEKMLAALKGLQWIIVDEVHELVANERGAHLSISLERLHAASLQTVTRIGLSATVGNLDETAKFISGTNRRHAILVD